jgi:hypothetical protein
MCFSATASFTTGALLLGMGGFAVSRSRSKYEMPYALIPVFFGIQQLLEGALWLSLAKPEQACGPLLTHMYSAFSQVIWPIYIPIAVLLLEKNPLRRTGLMALVVAGAVVSFYLLYTLTHFNIQSQVTGGHIAYIFPHFHQVLATGLYLLGACVSPMLSSHRSVRWFGVLITVSLIITSIFYSTWFISVWCFFAALTSCAVLSFSVLEPQPSVTTA